MKKQLDSYLGKLFSRRFQVLLIAIVLFLATDRFSDVALTWVFGVYLGASTLQKIAGGRPPAD